MTKFRVIYDIMALKKNGKLVAHYFAANKKTVEKIRRTRLASPDLEVHVRRLFKYEHYWVNPKDVERL